MKNLSKLIKHGKHYPNMWAGELLKKQRVYDAMFLVKPNHKMQQIAMIKPRYAKFISEYVHCWNGRKSAISAGYSAKGAHEAARRILRRPEVAAEIEKITKATPADARLNYDEFLEIASQRVREGGRDSTSWANLLCKAAGWQVENVRLQHQELPLPVFCMNPDNLPTNVLNDPDDNGIESQ